MNLAVLGLQWGDEGKGKAIDYLAGDFDIVVRYQGGHNAGHTIYYQGQRVILHLLPSGIFSPKTVSVIGNGVVINPIQLVMEIQDIKKKDVSLDHLEISLHAPLILPVHERLDIVFENSRYVKIGTTKRGIGPAYEDLTGRRAVFVGDLLDRDRFYRKVKPLNEYYNRLITSNQGQEIQIESYIDDYCRAGEFLKPFAKNTIYGLNEYFRQGKKILFEGAQGTLLDIHFGTYPFVTSSHTTIGGLLTGTGLSHKAIDRVVGISKAYTTRVGGGPFPSELDGSLADILREKGAEYGATTGRPRRVGWLDLVALRYAVQLNGVDALFLTKLDVLEGFDEFKAVVAYQADGAETNQFNQELDFMEKARPVLKSFKGWRQKIGEAHSVEYLPDEAKAYLAFIEEYIQIPVQYISTGPSREQTIMK